jgi:hypothetical protein
MDKTKDNQSLKLSAEEMEGAKGGSAFAQLSTFVVKATSSSRTIAQADSYKPTVICWGQTRRNADLE